jgi:hypothetical protein
VRTVYSPHPKTADLAKLLAREITLTERATSILPELTPAKRGEIERELAVVRRLLDQLGYQRTA